MSGTRAKTRLALLAAGVACLFALAAHGIPHTPAALRAAMVGYGIAAPLVALLAWTVLTPALVSGTLLAAASGLLFGPALGTAIAILGATAGGAVSFVIARRFGSSAARQLEGRRLQRLCERVEGRPFGALVLLRAAPGMPVTLLNYAVGLTRVRLSTFAAASAVGGAPRIFAYTALGGSLANATSPLGIVALSLIAAMGVAGALVALRTRLRARPTAG